VEAFFYVNGDPSKGTWVNMEDVESHNDILAALAEKGVIPRNSEGDPDYDGDLLVAGYDGKLVGAFRGKSGAFDLKQFVEARSFCDLYGYPHEAAAAYVENCGRWSEEGFYNSYVGKYDSVADFAHEESCELGDMENVPDYIRHNIDWGGVARYMLNNGDIWTAESTDGDVFVFYSV